VIQASRGGLGARLPHWSVSQDWFTGALRRQELARSAAETCLLTSA